MAEPVVWLEVTKAVATVGATLVAAWWAREIGTSQRDIARRQADTATAAKKVSEAKLNLDLFEERYAIFEKVWEFLSQHVFRDPKEMPASPAGFNALIPKAQFLFGKEIADYMRLASGQHVKWWMVHKAVEQRAGNVATQEESQKVYDLSIWFSDEASNCFKKFAPYLDFSAWKADPLERLFNLNAA